MSVKERTIDGGRSCDPSIFVVPIPILVSRMYNLEQVLPANDACILYDPLMDEEGTRECCRGFPRLVMAIENLKLWKYRDADEAAQHSNETTQQEMADWSCHSACRSGLVD